MGTFVVEPLDDDRSRLTLDVDHRLLFGPLGPPARLAQTARAAPQARASTLA